MLAKKMAARQFKHEQHPTQTRATPNGFHTARSKKESHSLAHARAAQSPARGMNWEFAINAVLTIIEAAGPEDEIEGILGRAECTHTATMAFSLGSAAVTGASAVLVRWAQRQARCCGPTPCR